MDDGTLLVVGAAALWLYSKAHTGMSLQFVPLGASWDGGALHVQLGVQNPTTDSLQFNSLAATAYINNNPIGNISDFTPALIAPGQTPISLTFVPNFLGVATTVLNQLNNGGAMNASIRGSANVNSIPVPVNLNFQIIGS